MRSRFETHGIRSRVATSVARGVGAASRAWKQRGLGTVYKTIGRMTRLRGAHSTVEFAPGSFFDTDVFEPTWAPVIIAGRPYEPELLHIMRRLRDVPVTFVDCGANYGYWSIVATGEGVGWPHAVAIEPNPPTFAGLRRNATLNGERFRCIEKAVSDEVGLTVTLVQTAHHAGAHVGAVGAAGIAVLTTTIDAALAEQGWSEHGALVIKLDVEGSELRGIAGARLARERHDHLLIVEDWQSNDLHTSRALLGMGYAYYYVTQRGTCQSLRTIADVEAAIAGDLKVALGSNFVAVKPGGAFHGRLEAWKGDHP